MGRHHCRPDRPPALDRLPSWGRIVVLIKNNGYLARLHFNNCKMTRGEDRRNVVEEAAAKAAKRSKEEAAVKAAKSSKAEERHVDSWTKQGQGGRWTRAHRSARRALFTPYKVAGGPAKKDGLKRLRITRGRYFSSGKTFKIIDDWTVQSHAHRLLEGAWIGTTDFRRMSSTLTTTVRRTATRVISRRRAKL